MEAWHQFLREVEKELGTDAVERWLMDLKISRFDAGNLYLEARDSFQVGWFEEHVRPLLKRGLLNNNQRPIRIHIAGPPSKKEAVKKNESSPRLIINPDPIDSSLSLDHFVPSGQNLMAYKLILELSASAPCNPIYLYGPQGSGKTHLLMGAAQVLQRGGKRVFYVLAEKFTEHVVQAIRLGLMQEFRKVYRDIDVLIVDGIHIFSRKNATQEEFFHTFNTLHTLGKLILLSANVPPSSLIEIEPRLISRFEWGISIGLEKPDLRPILEKKASLWNISLSSDLINFLLDQFSRNPIQALQALSIRAKNLSQLTVEIAKQLLSDLLEEEQKHALTPEKIVKSIAAHFGIRSEDLLGKSQMREYAVPRQAAMYLCRERLKMPYQKIGELFDRDHSTVISSVKLIQKAVDEKNPDILAAIGKAID